MDLKNLSPIELQQLIANAEKAIELKKKETRVECLKALHETAAKYGFKLSEFIDIEENSPKSAKVRKPAAAKYMNLENTAETWTGRGIAPKWLQAKMAEGFSKEDFAL